MFGRSPSLFFLGAPDGPETELYTEGGQVGYRTIGTVKPPPSNLNLGSFVCCARCPENRCDPDVCPVRAQARREHEATHGPLRPLTNRRRRRWRLAPWRGHHEQEPVRAPSP